MAKLILLRGLPGSGKSTFAKFLYTRENTRHFEADMFFDIYNQNKFDASLLSKAHSWCLENTKLSLENYYDVIVSNTFTQEWEMQPYFDMAKELGVEVTVLIVENYHGNSSIHNVPEETINKMRKRFEIKL